MTNMIDILQAIQAITPLVTQQAAVVAALTDNGGGTADGTVASMAAATALTDSTGYSGTHDDTLAATSIMSDITGGQDPTEAEFNTLLAVVRVMAQNASDTAQKVNELITWQTTVQNNVKECTAKITSILANLKTAGLMASS